MTNDCSHCDCSTLTRSPWAFSTPFLGLAAFLHMWGAPIPSLDSPVCLYLSYTGEPGTGHCTSGVVSPVLSRGYHWLQWKLTMWLERSFLLTLTWVTWLSSAPSDCLLQYKYNITEVAHVHCKKECPKLWHALSLPYWVDPSCSSDKATQNPRAFIPVLLFALSWKHWWFIVADSRAKWTFPVVCLVKLML